MSSDKGNMTSVDYISQTPTLEWATTWNEDNRLVSATRLEGGSPAAAWSYGYDYAGRRLLRREGEGARERSFFQGLTENLRRPADRAI